MQEFLEECHPHFELILYSNGSQHYTESVLTKLKETVAIKSYFEHILCREQCSVNDKGHEIKNLEFFTGAGSGRDIRDCIVIDNSIYCYQNHLTSGLFVPNYNFSDSNDDWLNVLRMYLLDRFITKQRDSEEDLPDVRMLIGRDMRIEEVFALSTVS